MMHSQLPTVSLNLDSYLPSPKYRQESTLVASPQKNRFGSNDSSFISPLKEPIPTTNRNLSSLILMSSPVKTAPLNQKASNLPKVQQIDSEDVQMRALNLSANIFMNSTTKFLKGFAGIPTSLSLSKQKNISPSGRENRLMSMRKGQSLQKTSIDVQNSNIISSAPKYLKQTNIDKVVYPSREKIEKIVRGQSIKKGQVQSNASQKLQQALSRNRVSGDKSDRNVSISQRSRSGSVQKLSRRRSRSRELKFLEKKQRSETSLTLKQMEKVPVTAQNNKMGMKTQIGNNRANVNQIKSTDAKKAEETSRPQGKPHIKANQKVALQNTPSILSNNSITDPKSANKREGFKPISKIPSGQLPLQTPLKPPQKRAQPNKNVNAMAIQEQTNKVRPQLSQISQISQIKQQKTTEMQSIKPIAKNKQISFQKSTKQQPSTYIHQNPTEAVVCGANETIISKLGKNQSTKALGISAISKVNNLKDNKTELKKVQSAKTINRKLQSSKIIPLEPIPSSPSILSEKKVSQFSAVNKKTLKTDPKQSLSSKISIQQQVIANNQPKTQYMEKKLEKTNNLKKSLALIQNIGRIYTLRLNDGLLKLKNSYIFRKIHVKQANVLMNESSNFYNNFHRTILKVSFEQLKKLTLSNPINKKSALNLDNSKLTAVNLIFRIITSKYRQNWQFFKYFTRKNMQFPSFTQKQTKVCEIINRKPYIIQQLYKILQKYNKNKIHNSFSKLLLFSSTHKKPNQRQVLPTVRTTSKLAKPARDYQSQKSVLIQQKQSLQYEISRIQWRLSDKKRFTERQKTKWLKSQAQLTKKNKSIEEQVNSKRNRNKFLKVRVQSSEDLQQIDFLLPECEPLMGILTDIYSKIFRSSQGRIDPTQLISKYCLNKQQPNILRQQWAAISLNISLKSELTKFQGPNRLNHPKQILIQEQHLILNLLRSYMRQRYLWQCLRVTADTL